MEFEGDGRDMTAEFVAKHAVGVRTFTIYFDPEDYPGKYVVRGFRSFMSHVEAEEEHHVVDSIDAARAKIPDGFALEPRHMMDSPKIVECWV